MTTRDPVAHAKRLTEATREAQERADSLRVARDQAIRDAVDAGVSRRALGAALDLSPSLVRKVLDQ
jgi:hypothetical protein